MMALRVSIAMVSWAVMSMNSVQHLGQEKRHLMARRGACMFPSSTAFRMTFQILPRADNPTGQLT